MVEKIINEYEIKNTHFIAKLKQIVDSNSYQLLVSVRTPILVQDYVISKFREWIEFIDEEGKLIF